MPDSSSTLHEIKISELPVATAANATDQLETNQAGTSRSITLDQVATVVAASDQIGAAIDAASDPLNVVHSFGAKGDGVTDDTAAFQAAASSGKTIYVPAAPVFYLIPTGNITVASDTTFIGGNRNDALIKLGPTTLNPLFVIGTSTNVAFRNLHLVGNQTTQQSLSSGSAAISGNPGCADIIVDNCIIEDWTRHGISLDGVTRATITNNFVQRCYAGAGILTSNTTISTDVKVTNNTVKQTHQGNIQAFFGVVGWVVSNNYCDTTAWGNPDLTDIADNITSYQLAATGAKNFTIDGNVCLNSGNNGMHIGVVSAIISNNVVINPANAGIAVWGQPNTAPEQRTNTIVSGNDVSYTDNTNAAHIGIGIRNLNGFTVTGNIVRNAYTAFQIRSIDPPAGGTVTNGTISGNTTINTRLYSVELNSTTSAITGVVIDSNSFGGDISNASSEDIRYNTANTADDILVGANNYSANATIGLRRAVVTSGNSTIRPSLKAAGSPVNIDLALVPKGTGQVRLDGPALIDGTVFVDRTGDATGALVDIRSDIASAAQIFLRSGTSARWSLQKNTSAESGSDVGSNFSITCYNDAGATIATPFFITRATGIISITTVPVTLSGTAIAAGANTQAFIKASTSSNFGIFYGTGDPAFSAAKGSLYTKTDATTTTTRLWVNTNGSTTWTFLTTAA